MQAAEPRRRELQEQRRALEALLRTLSWKTHKEIAVFEAKVGRMPCTQLVPSNGFACPISQTVSAWRMPLPPPPSPSPPPPLHMFVLIMGWSPQMRETMKNTHTGPADLPLESISTWLSQYMGGGTIELPGQYKGGASSARCPPPPPPLCACMMGLAARG